MPDGTFIGLFCCQKRRFRKEYPQQPGNGTGGVVIETVLTKSYKSEKSYKSDKSYKSNKSCKSDMSFYGIDDLFDL
jgi:hypothetical protein